MLPLVFPSILSLEEFCRGKRGEEGFEVMGSPNRALCLMGTGSSLVLDYLCSRLQSDHVISSVERWSPTVQNINLILLESQNN